MGALPNPLAHRTADHPILDVFLKRWSPRALTGEAVSEQDLMRLFEAARWAPSTYNEQEWRFLYAHRDTPDWPTFFGLLMEANQTWCKNAGVLIVALSKKTFTRNGTPNPVHSIDCGMAVENLMLQAASMPNIVSHGMAGFDRTKTRQALQVPDDYEVECMIAVGRPGDPGKLPKELQEREVPTGRKKIAEFARAGKFAFA
jgi:nitroreductase